jgi:hypothetical protein
LSDYLAFVDQLLIDSGAPATHAIVIGVGDYPHLNGGTSTLTTLDGGLNQLSSPPESAREVVTWLLDKFTNVDKPLASLSLLISEKDGPQPLAHARLPAPFTPKEATIAHVKQAVRDWKDLGDKNEENLVLFFFCGHGVASGLDSMTLLVSDYGKDNNMPMEGAVDFAAMHRGMAQCKASYQCYFVDACRTVDDIASNTTAQGEAIIQDNKNRPSGWDWNYAILYSTLAGEKAYGRKNKPSFYTEELILGLNGTGANSRNGAGAWRVSTNDLCTAVHRGLSHRGKKIKSPMASLVDFEFHELTADPIVPVWVYCEKNSDTDQALFKCLQGGNIICERPPQPDKWRHHIPHGMYDFKAEVGTRSGQRDGSIVMPPYQEVEIKVEDAP